MQPTTLQQPVPAPTPDAGPNRALALLGRFRSIIVLILMLIVASQMSDRFMTPRNLLQIVTQNSYVGILAVGMTFVILTGGIDLSVGSVMLCAGVVTAGILKAGHVGPGLAILACIGIGTVLGLVNGIMVAGLRLPPFIATLAMMVGAISIGQLYSNGSPIIVGDEIMPATFKWFDAFLFAPPAAQQSASAFPGIPVSGLLFFLVAFLAYIVLTKTRYGRYVYAQGGNPEATRLSGVDTRVIEASVYVISGMLAGFAALIYTARLQSGQALYGSNLELDAIAAAVIGGASLMGGVGSVGGTIVGVLFVGALIDAMQLRNVDPYMQGGIRALAIILGVLIQTRKKS